jgi:hypothetical protein
LLTQFCNRRRKPNTYIKFTSHMFHLPSQSHYPAGLLTIRIVVLANFRSVPRILGGGLGGRVGVYS